MVAIVIIIVLSPIGLGKQPHKGDPNKPGAPVYGREWISVRSSSSLLCGLQVDRGHRWSWPIQFAYDFPKAVIPARSHPPLIPFLPSSQMGKCGPARARDGPRLTQ